MKTTAMRADKLLISLTCKQHEQAAHFRAETNGCAEEMKSRRVLLHCQMNETEIIRDFPVERTEVVCSL